MTMLSIPTTWRRHRTICIHELTTAVRSMKMNAVYMRLSAAFGRIIVCRQHASVCKHQSFQRVRRYSGRPNWRPTDLGSRSAHRSTVWQAVVTHYIDRIADRTASQRSISFTLTRTQTVPRRRQDRQTDRQKGRRCQNCLIDDQRRSSRDS